MKAEHNSHSLFYRNPEGAVICGEEVKISFALKDSGIPDKVNLITTLGTFEMYYENTIGDLNIYSAKVSMPEKPQKVFYHFEVLINGIRLLYGNNEKGLGGIGKIWENDNLMRYQITVYKKDYKTPEWFKKSICYQIFPDRFFRDGDFSGEKPHMKKRNWGETPYYKAEQFGGVYDCSDFFGGNLKGIKAKLPYLKDLGVGTIYLNPIFEAYSNHRYDTGNYEKIDSVLGTEKDFSELCKEAEKSGIRIILDGVFNHTGSDSLYFNKNGTYETLGAYQSKESPYYSWFRFFDFPEKYESWWGIETLPQVEEKDENYRKYILSGKDSIIKRWLRIGASGWRLDVADELPDSFIKELRREAKSEKEDAVIIGEVWEDASNKVAYGEEREYLLGDELDSVMNYPLKNAIIDFALSRCTAKDFEARTMSIKENYPKEAFYSLLNFLSSHDVERVLTLFGGDYPENKSDRANYFLSGEKYESAKRKLMSAYSILFTYPGVPCIFYGDEAGLEGFGDPFCRKCFPWDNIDLGIYEHIKTLSKLRNTNDALLNGDIETVYSEGQVYGFIRRYKEKNVITVANFGFDTNVRLDLARFGIKEITDINGEKYVSDNGIFCFNTGKDMARIFMG